MGIFFYFFFIFLFFIISRKLYKKRRCPQAYRKYIQKVQKSKEQKTKKEQGEESVEPNTNKDTATTKLTHNPTRIKPKTLPPNTQKGTQCYRS
jgi:hypothetical protein